MFQLTPPEGATHPNSQLRQLAELPGGIIPGLPGIDPLNN
jgi:hypothetical protein